MLQTRGYKGILKEGDVFDHVDLTVHYFEVFHVSLGPSISQLTYSRVESNKDF